ncbi:MAG: choice-of-anchor tandem repeat GloVer-containing protein, partial [Candidatus Sulfotelmatobacter sp.]
MKFSDLVGSWFTVLVLSLATLFVATRPVQAQTETVLYNFCLDPGCSDGINPYSSLTSDAAGNFYGTTISGGEFGQGAVFELSPNGNGGWNEA